ncbi:head-tail connector protein [Thalassococcus sp. BH17M4-6]|uniref:head-tail connector protein n=1 Tax=Thalassococcus sp. BH17M4-6 TaxID=3413148 RepID=UPI003BEB5627
MMLVEETYIAEADLPLAALKRHLRLGTGFAEDDLQDPVLASFLRAALAAVEGRTGKALLRRGFVLTQAAWHDATGQVLPLAPVTAITQLAMVDRYGTAHVVPQDRYRLERDSTTPRLMPMGSSLPEVPSGGGIELRFEAGFGAGFGDLPADLAQAVLLLAAHYYEYRDETALGQGCMPFGVTSLLARYRPLRMGFAT